MSQHKRVCYEDVAPYIEHPLKGLDFYDMVSISLDPKFSVWMKEYADRINKALETSQ